MSGTELAPREYLQAIADDLELIDKALADLPESAWSAGVPACPRWDLTRLVGHLGGVHRMVMHAIRTQAGGKSRDFAPAPGTDLRAWLAEGGAELLDVLAADPSLPSWSFPGTEGTVGFWQRRQAMENSIHRIDIDQTLGIHRPVPARVAADGVSEALDVLLGLRLAAGAVTLPEYAVELRAADAGAVWQVGPGQAVGSASADATTLYAALWKRAPLSELAMDGDVEAVEAMLLLPLTP